MPNPEIRGVERQILTQIVAYMERAGARSQMLEIKGAYANWRDLGQTLDFWCGEPRRLVLAYRESYVTSWLKGAYDAIRVQAAVRARVVIESIVREYACDEETAEIFARAEGLLAAWIEASYMIDLHSGLARLVEGLELFSRPNAHAHFVSLGGTMARELLATVVP